MLEKSELKLEVYNLRNLDEFWSRFVGSKVTKLTNSPYGVEGLAKVN